MGFLYSMSNCTQQISIASVLSILAATEKYQQNQKGIFLTGSKHWLPPLLDEEILYIWNQKPE